MTILLAILVALAAGPLLAQEPAVGGGPPGTLALAPCADPEIEGALCGSHEVTEDRDRPGGRRLRLRVLVLPATGSSPRPDPVFYLPGGPGAPATPAARRFAEHPARASRDIVLVDARGTAGEHALSCAPEGEDDLRDLLAVFPRAEIFAECRERLAGAVDFAEYSTPRMVDDFESLRQLMYGARGGSRVPLLIRRASEGDFRALAERAVRGAVGGSIAMGLLNSIVCSEDAARIDPGEIAAATEGTLLGDARVRRQLAVCDVWPRAEVDPDYGTPTSMEQPTLLISGTLDPVTPPRWGDEAAEYLPNGLHLVVPGGDAPGNDCLGDIVARFLEAGGAEGLDTACAEEIRYPEFELPEAGDGSGSAAAGRRARGPSGPAGPAGPGGGRLTSAGRSPSRR